MNLSRKIASAFMAVMLIFLGVGAAVYFNTRALVEHSHWVEHTHEVIDNVMVLRLRLKEYESGVRGFVASGRAELQPGDGAKSEIDEIFKRLRTLTADNPRQVKNFEELGPFLSKRMAALEGAIVNRNESGLASGESRPIPPVAIPAMDDANLRVMLETSRLLDTVVEEERTLLKLRNAATEQSASSTYWTILGGTLGTAILTSFAAWFLIRSVTLPVREALGHLSTTSTEMLSATSQQASTAQEQVSAVSETVATEAQITQTADNSALRAGTLGSSVQKSMEISENGRQAVQDAIEAVGGVKRQIGVTTDNIVTLARKAQAIGDIISTVTDIAEQTNMLALNAAIEASRAGEHGRGFAVVAAEVKALAGQSKRATAQIRDILGEIQKATNAAVFSTEEVTRSAASAERVAGQAGMTIKTLTETISEAARVGSQIVASAGQQAAGMKQINQAMRDLEGSARQNLSSTRQIEDAARNLNALGKTLQGVVGVER